MTVTYQKMDITTVERGIVAHGVNCQLRMGSGVAAAIKRKWPKTYTAYLAHTPFLGTVQMNQVGEDLWVANCYTQLNYGYDGKQYASLSAIEDCLQDLRYYAQKFKLQVFIPKIGCGLGGLNWTDVEPLVQQYFKYKECIVCEL